MAYLRDNFIFYESFRDASKDIEDPMVRLELYEAIIDYSLYEIEPENISPLATIVFKAIKPTLSTQRVNCINGKKGGLSKKKKPASENSKSPLFENEKAPLQEDEKPASKKNSSYTDTDTDTDTDKDRDTDRDKDREKDITMSGKPDDAQTLSPTEVKARAVADVVIPYLNELTGMHYKTRTNKTLECIEARINEGFTEADFRTVIWKMVREWKGTEYEKFLRPETLFSNKFEGYLNRPDTTQEEYEHNKSMKKYSRIYEWAMREEGQENEQDGVFQYGDTDQSDLPDFSANG